MKTLLLLSTILFFSETMRAQYCDSIVPTQNVDLTGSPYMTWTSAVIVRDGLCCSSSNPDNCLEFVITLHPNTIAISFDIASGAIPPGALYYQIDCGPVTPVGQPICISGVGPHHLTFCKPGNNSNTFSVTAYPDPLIGPDITLNSGCQGYIFANFYNEPSMSWTSVAPGPVGNYDGLLSCTSGCDTAFVNAPSNPPAFVDYLVCGSDIGGCYTDPICDTVRVNFIAPVAVDIDIDTAYRCSGDLPIIMTASISGGTAPYSINWNSGSFLSTESGISGIYAVSVTDVSGCIIAMDSAVIIENPLPLVDAGLDQAICHGTQVTLSGSGATSYSWNLGVVDGVPFNQGIGTVTYTVTGTDANGCQNTDQVDVTIWPLPNVSAGPDQVVCDGTAITLNGAGAVNYVWDNGVMDGIAFFPPIGSTIYSVIGTDANGCSSNDQRTITVNPLPNVGAGLDQIVCDGTQVTLNGSGAINYNWDNGVINAVAFTPAVGTVTYTVTGSDLNGCQNIDQVDVTVLSLPNVFAGADLAVCEGTQITLNGAGASVYSWDMGILDGVPFTQGVGTVPYTITGTDANGCENTDDIVVTVHPLPTPNAGPDQSVCEGTAITLNSPGGPQLTWDNGIQNGVPFVQAIGGMQYIVYDTTAFGCSASDTVRVDVLANPVIFANEAEICEGEEVVLTAGGAISYSWTGGIQNGLPFYPNSSAIYTVTGTAANGCTSVLDVFVDVHLNPMASFDWQNFDLSTTEPSTGFNNTTIGAGDFIWNFGDGSPESNEFEPFHEFPSDEGGVYEVTLTATSPEGCVDVFSRFIELKQDYNIFVPNAFTPNANGMNEIFKPILDGFDEQGYTLLIFNRWGQLVFESHNMEVGWDGSFAQRYEQAQDGVYSWKVIAKVKNSGMRKEYVGHVSLLK